MEISITGLAGHHLDEIAVTAREIDKEEIWLQTGKPLGQVLVGAIDCSSESWAGYADDDLVCIWGVTVGDISRGVGVPWLIATDGLEEITVPFLRRGWYYLNRMKVTYPILQNVVYEKNVTAKRWLQWMGFDMGEIVEYGAHRAPFRHFQWRQ